METTRTGIALRLVMVAALATCVVAATLCYAKGKNKPESLDDSTYRLFQLLDDSYGGKLTGFCLLADTYTDPANGGQAFQHVLQVDYDKSRFFGRFRIYVRGVSPLTPGQLKEYTAGQIYGFGSDVERFEKINPGPFGGAGDVYFRSTATGGLAPAPLSDDARKEYEFFITRYIAPALEAQARYNSTAQKG